MSKSQWAFLERAMPLLRALLRLRANWWMWEVWNVGGGSR